MDKITLSDFQKLDIRIGTIIDAVIPEWSHWVIKLTVDLGEEIGKRTIFAGIMKFFAPKDLIGKQFPFITNIEPKKMGPEGDYSEGMMLAALHGRSGLAATASNLKLVESELEEVEEIPVLISPQEKVLNGSKVR